MNNIIKKLHSCSETTQIEQVTTRTQLKGYGASQYQARMITQNLTPTGISKKSYTYAVSDVISSIKQSLDNSRIQLKTRQNLEAILNTLLDRLGNVIKVPFMQGTDPELSQVSKQLFKKMTKINHYLTELKGNVATLKGKNQQ